MPMSTQFQRNDGTLENLRWGWWHLGCFVEAYDVENPDNKVGLSEINGYVYTQEHKFVDESDGEILVIRPGDSFHCWR